MKQHSNFIFLIAMLILTSTSKAAYNLEVKAEYENWTTGLGGNTGGIIGGIGLGYYLDQYFIGGGVAFGNFQLENDSDKTISRKDLDLVIGYRLNSQWSLFTGYRYNRTTFTSQNRPSLNLRENTLGLGTGVSINLPLAKSWIAFGAISLSGLYSYNNFDEKGNGYSFGSEGGVLYSINLRTTVAVRIKYQMNKIEFSPGKWQHSYIRYGAHFGYLF